MRFVFASMALKSLLSFARVMTTLIAVFLQNSLTMVVNLKTSMDGSVRRQKTNRYPSKFHRLHPRPDYSFLTFLGKLKGALLESALIEFFIVSFNTRYTTISNSTDTIAMKGNLKTTTYVHLCFDLGICISIIMILSLNHDFGYQLT